MSLCIQDGTGLNFATRPGCKGPSIIGRNQTSAKTLGLDLHLTLALSGADLPLGVLRCGSDTPPPGEASSEQAPGESGEEHCGNPDAEPETDDSVLTVEFDLDFPGILTRESRAFTRLPAFVGLARGGRKRICPASLVGTGQAWRREESRVKEPLHAVAGFVADYAVRDGGTVCRRLP